NADEAGDALVKAFVAGSDDEGADPGPDGVLGVDELHVVYTEFQSMLSQTPVVRRIAPMAVDYDDAPKLQPLYDFEPDVETLLGALLPKYVKTR
ncbi:F0F1 ATP synthase subunit gamma, partial [Saccharothrix sp. MB29]|nr:F0F1 ATP synthase subunit gamma [Saccharothrix sp. MB29]